MLVSFEQRSDLAEGTAGPSQEPESKEPSLVRARQRRKYVRCRRACRWLDQSRAITGEVNLRPNVGRAVLSFGHLDMAVGEVAISAG